MTGVLAKLLMLLIGFILAFLGVLIFIHVQHYQVGILIFFAGVLSMFQGLPKYN